MMARVDRFGDKLRRLRQRLGLQQTIVALRAKTDKSHRKNLTADEQIQVRSFSNYLSRLETGKEDNPSLDLLSLIARGYGFASLSKFFDQLETYEKKSASSSVEGPSDTSIDTVQSDITDASRLSAATVSLHVPVQQQYGHSIPDPALRRQLMVDLAYSLLDEADRLVQPRKQTPMARAPRPKLSRPHRRAR